MHQQKAMRNAMQQAQRAQRAKHGQLAGTLALRSSSCSEAVTLRSSWLARRMAARAACGRQQAVLQGRGRAGTRDRAGGEGACGAKPRMKLQLLRCCTKAHAKD